MSTHSHFIHRTKSETAFQSYSNLKIREIMNVQHNIIEIIDERLLRWFRNMKRTEVTEFQIGCWSGIPKTGAERGSRGKSRWTE